MKAVSVLMLNVLVACSCFATDVSVAKLASSSGDTKSKGKQPAIVITRLPEKEVDEFLARVGKPFAELKEFKPKKKIETPTYPFELRRKQQTDRVDVIVEVDASGVVVRLHRLDGAYDVSFMEVSRVLLGKLSSEIGKDTFYKYTVSFDMVSG